MTVDALVCASWAGANSRWHTLGYARKKAGCRAKAAALHFRRRRTLWRLLVFEGSAFAGNEDCSRRFDGEFFRVIALVDGDADAAERILIKKVLADGNVLACFVGCREERLALE